MGMLAREFEKVEVDSTLQKVWIAAHRDYLKLHEPILFDSQIEKAVEYADKVVESLKKCRYG